VPAGRPSRNARVPLDIASRFGTGIALIGFVPDSLFRRLRVTRVLPLMLIGVILVPAQLLLPVVLTLLRSPTLNVPALTTAFIFIPVDLEIRFAQRYRVFRGATAYTIGAQRSTALLTSMIAIDLFGWTPLIGPPVRVRALRAEDHRRTDVSPGGGQDGQWALRCASRPRGVIFERRPL
jgi:hypothetical protein